MRICRKRRGRQLLSLIAAATLLPCAPSAGQVTNNAADVYREAFELFEARPYEWDEYVPVQQFLDNPTVAPSREVREFLGRYKRAMDLFQRASTRRDADFGIDLRQGSMLLLPHLAPMRQVAKMARADAEVRLLTGDSAGAARRLASIYRAGRHVGQDGIAISSLVGIALAALADNTTGAAFDRMALTVEDVRRLHRTIDRFDEADPFNVAGGFRGEHELLRHDIEQLLDADYLERRRQIATMEAIAAVNDALDAHRLAEMDRAEIARAIERHDRFTRQAIEIVLMTDDEQAAQAMAELVSRANDGEFGVLAPFTASTAARVLSQHHRGRELISDRRAMLESIIRGESLENFAGAAYFYLRAIETMETIAAPEELEALRAAADDRTQDLDESIETTLVQLAPAIEFVRKGTMRETCDFSIARPRSRAMMAAPYAAGLHDLMRILNLEHRRMRTSGDAAALADHFVMTIRFCSHLSADTLHMTSAIAHDGFSRVLPALEAAMQNPDVNDDQRNRLRESVALISRTDPFGYGSCRLEPRLHIITRMDLRQQTYPQLTALAAEWTAERWYFLTAVLETAFVHDLVPDDPDDHIELAEFRYATHPDDLSRLANLYDEAALRRAQQVTPEIVALVREGDFLGVDQVDAPKILDITGRMAQARRDLTRALRIVGLPEDGE